MKFVTATALLLAFGTSTAAAQHPQVREGFWIAFGFGGGSADVSCDGCVNTDREMGATGFVRLGGTLNDRILLGGEINGWAKHAQGNETYLTNTSFAVYFYPRPASGLFVRGGVGWSLAGLDAPGGGGHAEASGFGFIVGGGYDIRVGPRISITPAVSFYFGGDGDLIDDGTLVGTGVKHSILEIALGLTFH